MYKAVKNFFKINKISIILAILSGILLIVIFPKLELHLLSWVVIVPLLFAIEGKSLKHSFIIGFIFGLVGYSGVLYWIVGTVNIYGHLPLIVSIILFQLLILYMAIFPAFFALFLNKFKNQYKKLPSSVIASFTWVSLEFIRSWLLTGFPWEFIGYSQYKNLTFIQFSDITSVYGVSFIIIFGNYLIFESIKTVLKNEYKFPKVEFLYFLVFIIFAFTYGKIRISSITEEIENGKRIKVGLTQGNIKQDMKWNKEFREETLRIYRELSLNAISEGAEFIVWPETAIPKFYKKGEQFPRVITELAKKTRIYFLVGIPSYKEVIENDKELRFAYNSAYLISPSGNIEGSYDKVHLVPFGEYIPNIVNKYFPFIEKLTEGTGNFDSSNELKVLEIPQGKFNVLICYEVIFPNLVRQSVKKGSQFIVNITNDAWFNRTSAPYQHLSMAVFRAVENKRFLVRAANTGITAVISPIGIIKKETDIFTRSFIVDEIVPIERKTFYVIFGDFFAYCNFFIMLFLLFLPYLQRSVKKLYGN